MNGPSKAAAAVLLAALAGCGPSLKTVSRYVESSPHRRVAVVPFSPAPGRPNSGEAAADLLSEQLESLGFTLVNRADLKKVLEEQKLSLTGAVKAEDASRVGLLLGAEAVLTGTVGEYEDHRIIHPAVYVNGAESVWDRKTGAYKQVPTKSLVRPAEEAHVAVFAVTAHLTDVESGALLWVASGADQAEDEPIQQVAGDVLKDMARGLARKLFDKKM